ncbi:spore germination protein [Fontibacillus phaseoli]|uniref:Spore germination protein n=1 Tax=Fontibacillus phaseoli TaxID=1416533 RepID=A0A369BLL1_9BACL|nr:Ger(x)C family spore germination protein [Fontibacillus phaseoli]RCX20584.1 spore germination protein [Fontibacillus phaseoli]
MLRKTGLLSAVCLLLLTSCSQDQHILERIGYIRTAGYDLQEGGKLKITLSVPLIINEASQTFQTDEILTTVATSSKEARIKLSRKTSRNLVSGQLRTILFNTDLAKQGLHKHMDTLLRDPSISKLTELVIVDGSAHEIMTSKYSGHPRTAQYIDRLLKKEFNMETTPRILLHEFFRDYYDDGKDPIATMLRKSGNDLELNGIALFRNDKYITKLPPEDIFYFSIMYQNQGRGEFTVVTERPEMKSITFTAINSRKKIKIKKNQNGKYVANIGLKIEGGVLEYIGNLDLSTSDKNKLEGIMSEYISQQAKRIVGKLQHNRTDSLGIGQHVRNKMSYKAWKDTDWEDIYANMDIQVHAKFMIKNFGNFYD